MILMATPLVFLLVKSPALAILQVGAGLALLGIRIVVHLVTLPVEFDASFGKALPVLTRGRYLSAGDLPAARSVLTAAAYTYVAAALASLIDVARWVRVLRFCARDIPPFWVADHSVSLEILSISSVKYRMNSSGAESSISTYTRVLSSRFRRE